MFEVIQQISNVLEALEIEYCTKEPKILGFCNNAYVLPLQSHSEDACECTPHFHYYTESSPALNFRRETFDLRIFWSQFGRFYGIAS